MNWFNNSKSGNSLRHRAERASASLPALMDRAERAASAVLNGENRQRRQGAGDRFWQFRDYDPSDAVRDIDWRRSGRGDRVLVRQKELQTAQTAYFWAQNDAGMQFRSASPLPFKNEDASVLALALAIVAVREDERVAPLREGFIAKRGGQGVEQLARYFIDLNTSALSSDTSVGMMNIPAHATIVLAGDFLQDIDKTKIMLDRFSSMKAHGILIQVLDPAELDLPFTGRMIFEQPDRAADHPVMNVESVREAYNRRINDHCAALNDLCRAQGWRYLRHHTGDDCGGTLMRLWTGGAP